MVSNIVKEARMKRGMSIAELARRTELSRVTIANVENRLVAPTLETALLISRELENGVENLFFLNKM